MDDSTSEQPRAPDERMMPCPRCGKPARLDGEEELGARWYVCLDQHQFRVTPGD